ncbi:MAG: CDP-alcohol phosphatidyltransferase family protein [Hyphomicrobiales bacterium]|nr:CDP-alcohol phosphatidyltransferase family protein [Hyphomicrobiales bacterium]
MASSASAPVLIASGAILAETGWLTQAAEAQIEPAVWAAVPGRILVLSRASALAAVEALSEEGAAYDLAAVERCLVRRFGAPAKLTGGADPMVVETLSDVRAAERRLLLSLVKETDGFMARHLERPISLRISRLLAPTSLTPNQTSLISVLIGVCGGPFFLFQSALWQTVGALMFLAHSILDGCDGELARLKFEESRWGGVLDFWGDNVVHAVIFGCMALGWSHAAGAAWPLWAGAAAVLGTLGSAGFVYWRLMRPKGDAGVQFTSVSAEPERPLARLLDAASRRDFIYLVLILALAGKSNWFLALAAIGAPIYLLLLLIVAAREPRAGAAKPSAALAARRQLGPAGGG